MTPHVARRRVLYLSGFDPRGPAHAYRLYAAQGARQAAVCGYRLEVGPRAQAAWTVRAEMDGRPTDTQVECLRWDDLVRAHWPRGALGAAQATVQASWALWRSGLLWRTVKTSWPAALALGLPSLVAGVSLLLALAARWWPLPALVGLAAMAVAIWRLRLLSFVPWLMRSMVTLFAQGRGETPELDARLDAFAARLIQVLDDCDADEVLLVGHSSGATLAMSVAARALRHRPNARLSLLTLGHSTQMLSQQPQANPFRAELMALTQSPGLTWVDVTAPPDACCMALVSPTWHAGAALAAQRAPTLVNPRFAQLFAPDAYPTLRRDKYRCHFQYLMASQLPGAWDYFAVTAGPLALGVRFPHHLSITHFTRFQLLGGGKVC